MLGSGPGTLYVYLTSPMASSSGIVKGFRLSTTPGISLVPLSNMTGELVSASTREMSKYTVMLPAP